MTCRSTLVDVSALPRTIHDFYGFPQPLHQQQYPAPREPELAREVVTLLASHQAEEDDTYGLDHLFAEHLTNRNFAAPANHQSLGYLLKQAHPSLDHYILALTIAGLSDGGDQLTFMNDGFDLGTISMRSYIFHAG